MINTKEAASALYGLWRIARWDDKAFDFFNATEHGFWRSFIAAAFVAPLQAIYQISVYMTAEQPPTALRMFFVEGLEYITLWFLYPVAMLSVVKLLDRNAEFFRYLVAYNWFQLAVGFIAMPIIILSQLELLPLAFSGFFDSMVFVAYVTYAAFIAREGLRVTLATGIGIVVLDILLTLVVGQITLRMLVS